MTQDYVFIATSATAERPVYRQDLLECLSRPAGHEASFTYRARWIEQRLLGQSIPGIGLPGILVFCDRPPEGRTEYTYYPLRKIYILEVEPRELLKSGQWNNDTYFTIRLKLDDYLDVDPADPNGNFNEWNNWFQRYQQRPRFTGVPNSNAVHFVFKQPDFPDKTGAGDDISWRLIVDRLGQTSSLEDCFFYRVVAISSLRKGGGTSDGFFRQTIENLRAKTLSRLSKGRRVPGQIRTIEFYGKQAYILSSRRHCTLEMTWFRPDNAREPEVVTSSDKVTLIGPLTKSYGKYVSGKVRILAKQVFEEETVALDIVSPSAQGEFKEKFYFVLRPSKGLLLLIVSLLAIGSLFTGVTHETLKDLSELSGKLSWLGSNVHIGVWGIKALGAVFVGLGGYLGFRRLPKGTGV